MFRIYYTRVVIVGLIVFSFCYLFFRINDHDLTPTEPKNPISINCSEQDLTCFGLSVNISNNRDLSKDESPLWLKRQDEVVDAFLHAWKGYDTNAFGYDEYDPIGKMGKNFLPKGFGFTIVDSLDTMILMGLEKEVEKSLNWIKNDLTFDQDGYLNVFETTIRVLGGLLSSHFLTNYKNPFLLEKAVDLADRLSFAFNTPTSIPGPTINLKTGKLKPENSASTSEGTTLQLEFKYLSHLTKNKTYWDEVEKVMKKIEGYESLDGLVPIYIDIYVDGFSSDEITLGARGDSYYEYLLKQYLQTQNTESLYKDMYEKTVLGIKKHLIGYTHPNKYTFFGEILKSNPEKLNAKMDHLVCFIGGNLALGVTEGLSLDDFKAKGKRLTKEDLATLELAKNITETCYRTYKFNPTGLAAEITYFGTKEGQDEFQILDSDHDPNNLLRPETVESLFILYRITKDNKYREWGWELFQNFQKYCKVEGGYVSLKDVRKVPPVLGDKMETFFLAETLKYFYLLFGNSNFLPLDKIVLNTEAHPLPKFKPDFESI